MFGVKFFFWFCSKRRKAYDQPLPLRLHGHHAQIISWSSLAQISASNISSCLLYERMIIYQTREQENTKL